MGQLLVVPIYPAIGDEHLKQAFKLLKEKNIGSVIFMTGESAQQKEVIAALPEGIWVFQDAEWGAGMRLKDVAPLPKNLTLGAIGDLELLRAFGREVANQCREAGVSGGLAPVADVNSNPGNPVIGRRSFGDDPEEVARRALAVMEGMQEGGLLACAKHFPGHGDTAIDSHKGLPIIHKPLEEINEIELIPFKALIEGGIDMVMSGHLLFPALSYVPSCLSEEILTGLLREALRFEGLIVTDSLCMRALADQFSLEECATKALLAGANLLLIATDQPEVLQSLIEVEIPRAIEVIKNTIPEAIIDERVERILRFKARDLPQIPRANPDLCRILYRQALTLLGDPIPTLAGKITLVQSGPDPDFEAQLKRYAQLEIVSIDQIDEVTGPMIVNIRKNDHVTHLPSEAIVTLFDVPYVLDQLPPITSVIVAYEDVVETKEAVADALFGKLIPLGKLPIRLFKQYGQGT